MFNKICFLVQTPPTQRQYEELGAEILIKRGFKVCFLDMTDYLNPEYGVKYQSDDLAKGVEVVAIKEKNELVDYLKENHGNTFFVDYIGSHYDKLFFMFQLFRKLKVNFAVYSMGAQPISQSFHPPKTNQSVPANRLFKILANNLLKKVIYRFLLLKYSLPNWLGGPQAPTFILAGGRKIVNRLPRADARTKIIYGHLPNYDLYLKKREQVKLDNKNYFVFLDQYAPFHPDLLIDVNSKFKRNAEKYYLGLNRLFEHIEKTFNAPVVIAAHPNAQYHLKPDFYRGRKIEKGKTLELVAASRCVLAHCCLSTDFAFLYKKPILIITSGEIEEFWGWGKSVYGYSEILGTRPINIDDEQFNLTDIDKVNLDVYNAYISDYIKFPGTPDRLYWDIVADHLLEEGA